MIEIDISDALEKPGAEFDYYYSGTPSLEGVLLNEPLVVQAKYRLDDSGVRVAGTICTQLAATCSRCLAEAHIPVREEFSEVFTRQCDRNHIDAFRSGDPHHLSLDNFVRDALLTAVPIKVLCKQDCRGLCPICGTNLNNSSCSCMSKAADEPDGENPFAVLKDLF